MIDENKLAGKRISVIGAGVSGRAIAELAAGLGAQVFVSDIKEPSQEVAENFRKNGIRWESGGNTDAVLSADEIVVSSGISPHTPIVEKAFANGVKVTGELDFISPYLHGTVIGITGSNGKTTTTSMIGYYLEQSGYSVITCGNIGNAAAHAAGKEYDFIVLELSSFQLHWAKNFKCDVAIVTNLAPDHINWHGSYENYVAAKANIIKCLVPGGAAIYQKRDEAALNISRNDIKRCPLSWEKTASDADGLYMDGASKTAVLNGGNSARTLFAFDDVKLLGSHNLENTAMALSALALAKAKEISPSDIGSFVPPGHRCAFAGNIGGVTFVDDSKGTNVAASVTAMTSLPGTKVVILGGQGKGEEYGALADTVKKTSRAAVILGTEKEKIADALSASGYSNYRLVESMEDAVKTAFSLAEAGDTVLLSPACTSWDMYPSYNVRGEHFCSIVKALSEAEE